MEGIELRVRAFSSDTGRTAGLAPGLACAGALHLAVALLLGGLAPSAAMTQPDPPTLTLVSLPLPEPEQPPLPAPTLPAPETPLPAAVAETPPEPEPSPAPSPVADAPAAPMPELPPPAPAPAPQAFPRPPKPVRTAAVPARPAAPSPARPTLRHQPAEEDTAAEPAQPATDTRPYAAAQAAPPAAPPAAPAAAAEASFEGRLLQAVQAEARRSYPASARLMGTTGQAIVAFQYRDGAVQVTGLAQTSGSPVLDRAALTAVQNASYPPPPSELAGRTLVKLVHVKFELNAG